MNRIDRRLALGALSLAIAAPASCFAPDYAVGAGGASLTAIATMCPRVGWMRATLPARMMAILDPAW